MQLMDISKLHTPALKSKVNMDPRRCTGLNQSFESCPEVGVRGDGTSEKSINS